MFLKVNVVVRLCVGRGVGCIFYEMAAGRPLFPGSTVEDELHLIFRLLGSDADAAPRPPPRRLLTACVVCCGF